MDMDSMPMHSQAMNFRGTDVVPVWCFGAGAIPDEFQHLDPALERQISDRPFRAHRLLLTPGDLLFYVYTSGTSGLPKAAKIRHMRMLLAGPAFFHAHGINSDDRLYCPLPVYHSAAGMISVSMCWYGGLTMILRRKFSASQFFGDCIQHRATVIQYIGELCRYLLATPPSIVDRQHQVTKALGNGLRPEVGAAFSARFGIPYIGEFYGSTEGNALLINNCNVIGACGYIPRFSERVYPLRVVKFDTMTETPIRNTHGFCEPCAWGEAGELLGRIDQTDALRQFDGYTSPEATNSKVLCDVFVPGDKWFRYACWCARDGA
jgi:acyl-CoA synthetase (AMP-forming)/AMP-acid ligase II